jgi:hypothetical protein
MCKDGDILSLLVLISREAYPFLFFTARACFRQEPPSAGYSVVPLFDIQPPTRRRTGPGEDTRAPRADNVTGRAGIRRRLIPIGECDAPPQPHSRWS